MDLQRLKSLSEGKSAPTPKVLAYAKLESIGLGDAEFFFVERLGTYYTLYFSAGGSLSLGIEATANTKAKGKSDFERLVKRTLSGVQKMGMGTHKFLTDKMDADAKRHLKVFDHSMFGVDWDKDKPELGSPQEDFLPYMKQQLNDWKGSSNALSVTKHEYWPEFHKMVLKAVRKKYGSSIKAYRGIFREQAVDILKKPTAPIAMRRGVGAGYTSFADSLDGAKAYRRLDHKEHWVVIRTILKPKDIALAPVHLPEFIQPDILMPLARDVYHSGDEFIVGPRKALKDFKILLKTRKPLPK